MKSDRIEDLEIKGRHDKCIALRVPPVLEAATAIVLADFMLMEQNIKRINKA
jgi:chorismate synthase